MTTKKKRDKTTGASPQDESATASRRTKSKGVPVNTDEKPPEIIAYRLNSTDMQIVPGDTIRNWMEETPNRFAYRCMPMLLSNQGGWMILNSNDITVAWDGRQALEALTINNMSGPRPGPALSVFGSGILTFTLPFLFRTPPGWNLVAQGPTNQPKDGIAPLSGIIETDWAESTFTMNWMFTRPNHTVTFKKGEPICMVIPQRRHELEHFTPVIRDIASNPELHADYVKWADSRRQFNDDLKKHDSQARKEGWQKHYAQGRTVSEKRTTSHQSKLTLCPFANESETKG